MMTKNSRTFGMISLALFTITACSETIIREIPAESQDVSSSEQTPLTPLTTANGQTSGQTTASTISTTTASGQSSTNTPVTPPNTLLDDTIEATQETPSVVAATSLINLADTQDGAIVGLPGMAVDCTNTIPCRWISEDEGFSVTVTNVDNIASLGRLAIQFRVNTLHDTSVSLSTSPRATDSEGVAYTVASQSLGLGNGISPSSLIAGIPITGALEYASGAEATTIAIAGISALDNGYLRDAAFLNLPVGSVQLASVDCALSLPCTLELPDEQSSITLLSAGGFSTTGSLVANFIVEVSSDTMVALDGGATAFGDEGTVFEGRTHTLGTEHNYAKVSQLARAGASLPGTVNFSRTGTRPLTLDQLHLILYKDSPVPRWNPTFSNVPLI